VIASLGIPDSGTTLIPKSRGLLFALVRNVAWTQEIALDVVRTPDIAPQVVWAA
jgi:hypothetical protein